MTAIGLPPGAAPRTTASRAGDDLHYFVAGDTGPHVVCVNAHGQDLLVFSRVVAELARDHRVVAWKPRGTFELARPVSTLWDRVGDLRSILDAEAVRACVLLSWCSGAKVAIELARQAPAVRALVLANGTFKTYPGLEYAETEFERTLLELCRIVVASPHHAALVMDSIRSLLHADATRRDPALAAMIAEPFQSPDLTLRYAAQVVDYLDHDIAPALAALAVPALVIAGEHDRVSSPIMARAIADRLPRGQFAQIDGGSHYCLYDSAADTVPVVAAFLRSVFPGWR